MKRTLLVAAAGALVASSTLLGTASAAHKTGAASLAGSTATRTVAINALNGSGVSGVAIFTYNSRTGITTVAMSVKGMALKAMSIHPEHIHAGSSCSANGPVIYPFRAVSGSMTTEANDSHVVQSVTAFTGTFVGKAYYINVHTGPGLATKAQFKVLACGAL